MADQPLQDPQLADLDKWVAQLKEYLDTHPSTAPVASTNRPPQSSSATRFWVIAIWMGAMVIAAVITNPVLVALYLAGLLALFSDERNSRGLSSNALPFCYLFYGILFLGVLMAPDRWLRTFIAILIITSLLNLGGCSIMLSNLRGIH
jgi:hypothetical protein